MSLQKAAEYWKHLTALQNIQHYVTDDDNDSVYKNNVHKYYTPEVLFIFLFLKKFLCSQKLHLLDQKFNKKY